MRTVLELFLCGLAGEDTVLFLRTARDITGRRDDPDRRLLSHLFSDLKIGSGTGETCAHSTSWRFDDGAIVLTYLALTPISSLAGTPAKLLCPAEIIPTGASAPLRPRPESIAEKQVLVHGLGHLRYLAEQRAEPFISAALQHAGTFSVLGNFAPTLAGRLQWP